MTVKELIEKLKACDPDAPVYVPWSLAVTETVEKAGEPSPCWTIPPNGECRVRMLLATGQDEWDAMCKDDDGEPDETGLPADGVLL